MNIRSRVALLAGAALLLAASAAIAPLDRAKAQTPSNPAPYNVDIGAIITNSLRAAGTVSSSTQANTNWRGVVCTMDITASSGSPSAAFKIQGYDAATASWQDYVQSGSIQANIGVAPGIKTSVVVYPGLLASAVPADVVGINMHLPRSWRVTQVISAGTGGTGKGPAMTGHLGCNYLL